LDSEFERNITELQRRCENSVLTIDSGHDKHKRQRICKHILFFCRHTNQRYKNKKSLQANAPKTAVTMDNRATPDRTPACNSTYPKGGVSCSKDSFVVNQTLVFQIKFCGKSPALRVAAKRYAAF
jgi:hypothetical protein